MGNWEKELDDLLKNNYVKTDKAPMSEEACNFMRDEVEPALEKLIKIFKRYERKAFFVVQDDSSRMLVVWYKNALEFCYKIKILDDKISCSYDIKNCDLCSDDKRLEKFCDGNTAISNVKEDRIGELIKDFYDRVVVHNSGC